MTEHERILCVLNKKEPDKTPWFADLSYLYESKHTLGTLDKKYLGEEGYLEFHKDLGAGICFYAPFPWKSSFSDNIKYVTKTAGKIRTAKYLTPIGNIACEEHYLPETFSWAITSHFVNTIEDLRIMKYIHENTYYSENFNNYQSIANLWGDYGIATGFPAISSAPLQKLLARWAGVENTVNLFIDHEDEFIQILDAIDESEKSIFYIFSCS